MSTPHDPSVVTDPHPRGHDRKLIADALAPVELPSLVLERLTATALVVELPAGPIRHPGPDWPVRALWLLRQGEISLGGRNRHGNFTEVRRVLPGEWVDVFGALGARPGWFDDMRALHDSEALALPLSGVMQLSCEDPVIGLAFGQLLSTQARQLRDGQSVLRNRSFGGRLASRILDETADLDRDRPHRQPARRATTGPGRKTTCAASRHAVSERRDRTDERLIAGPLRSARAVGRRHRPQRAKGVERVLEQQAEFGVTLHHQHAIEEQSIGIVQAAGQSPPARGTGGDAQHHLALLARR